MPASAREEAERLVAAIIARAVTGSGQASDGGSGLLGDSVAGLIGVLSRGDLATGSAECCVCPVCKAIAAVRDPNPETAERLAASAGDIASGVAGLMRAFSSLGAERPRPPGPRNRPAPTPDQAWSAATRPSAPEEQEPPARDEESDPWGAASAADARQAAAAARARAAAAEEAVARAVAQAKARAARPAGPAGQGTARPAAAGSRAGDVWAMATSEAAAGDAAPPRSVDHELGATAPEDRDPGQGDDARPGGAV